MNIMLNETSKIKGCRILITGGTTGIGREMALQIAGLGGNVLISGREEQHLGDTLADGQVEGEMNGIIADMSTSEGFAELFAKADELFDGELDVLINNAALAYNSVLDGGYSDWKE